MIRRAWLLAALAMLGASTFSMAQQQQLAVNEIAPGVLAHEGQTALMTQRMTARLPMSDSSLAIARSP